MSSNCSLFAQRRKPSIYVLFLGCLVSLLLSFRSTAQQKQLCITVDDLPTVSYGEPVEREITEKIISHFLEYHIPAIGFVNEKKLFKRANLVSQQVMYLRLWLQNGFELGNHTFSHPDYNHLSYREFIHEIEKGAVISRPLSKEFKMPWRYFRHPFLHTGSSKEKADSLHHYLHSKGYIVAPVTIDNADYLFAKAYSNANKAKDENLKKRIGTDYIHYMKAKTLYFEKLSNALFDRQIPQILLTHANLLNADYYDDLAKLYVEMGYSFVSLESALQDLAYQTEITTFGPWGISWLERWALSKKDFNREIFKKDVTTPKYIEDLAK